MHSSSEQSGRDPNTTGELSPIARLQAIVLRRLIGESDTIVAQHDIKDAGATIPQTILLKTMDSPDRTTHISLLAGDRGGVANYVGVGWWHESNGHTGLAMYDNLPNAALPYYSVYNSIPLNAEQIQRWREQGPEAFDEDSPGLSEAPEAVLLNIATALESPEAKTNTDMTEAIYSYYEANYAARRYLSGQP